jgi:hypothetical protein
VRALTHALEAARAVGLGHVLVEHDFLAPVERPRGCGRLVKVQTQRRPVGRVASDGRLGRFNDLAPVGIELLGLVVGHLLGA